MADLTEYQIALYYCYINILDTKEELTFQRILCQELDLRGRIRVSSEGLNGVLSGDAALLQRYEKEVRKRLLYNSPEGSFELDVKYCELRPDISVEEQLFQDLRLVETKTVISLIDMEASLPGKKKLAPIHVAQKLFRDCESSLSPAKHLSPDEWDKIILNSGKDGSKVVFLDCRNVYESNIGYFRAKNTTTILTNTRKYPELPVALLSERKRLQEADQVFMYCTGGVRCERASVFLQAMLKAKQERGENNDDAQERKQPEMYQLHGGIQRYLEQRPDGGLYEGKNFVFDPRRTDPHSGGSVVGTCLVCNTPHDDYDNGEAPAQNKEARCCNCRILILVCDNCRKKVTCWGEEKKGVAKLYCGKTKCIHTPPVAILE